MAPSTVAAWLLASALCIGCAASTSSPTATSDGGAVGSIDGGSDAGTLGRFDPAVAAALQSALDAQVRTQPLRGATLAVSIANEGTWIGAAGFKDASGTVPIVPADRFRVGSITKTFTGAVVMQLVEHGIVTLDDHLERWYPGFPNGNQITIRELMSHTSGVYDFLADSSFDRAALHQHTDMVNVAASHSAQFTTPGAAFSYSNTNFILLGLVIEAATHTPYAANVASRLLPTAGLSDTFVDDDPSTISYVHGFALRSGQWVDVTAGDSASVAWSAGAVVANANDLLSWISAMIDLRQPSHLKFGHDGAISGYESDVRIDPERGIAICALTNTDGADATQLADAAWAIVAK